MYCGLHTVKAKNVKKHITKKFARLHNHKKLLTMVFPIGLCVTTFLFYRVYNDKPTETVFALFPIPL